MTDMLKKFLGGDSKGGVDALLELIDPKDIEMKSNLLPRQYRPLFKLKLAIDLNKVENVNKDPMTILEDTILWLLKISVSREGESNRSRQIADSIKEMKSTMLESELITKQLAKK